MTEPEIPLPPLQLADLDEAAWTALLDDLDGAAEILAVAWKAAPTAFAVEGSTGSGAGATSPLAAVRTSLANGAPLSVQIRYRFRGATWRDTLMRAGSTVRLVRICEADVGG